MDISKKNHDSAMRLLRLETGPGLGCTEPAAIGLSAAAAASLLPNRSGIESIDVVIDPNLYKNAMGVYIPCSKGEYGIELSSAFGATGGDASMLLQAFAALDDDSLEAGKKLVAEGKVTPHLRQQGGGLYVKTTIKTADHTAEALIAGRHDYIESLVLDGQPVTDSPLLADEAEQGESVEDLEHWLTTLSIEEIVDIVSTLNSEDIEYLNEGIEMNLALAKYGMAHGPGLAVGKTQESLIRQGILKKDMPLWAGVITAAAIDSRMGGCALPAMTLGGSGNQGIAASVPVAAAAEFATLEDTDDVARAVALSYLITCFIKTGVGRLSAVCGSGVAGGAGNAAAIAWLLGGSVDTIGGAIKNHIENYATIICDGAKTSCAMKVAEACAAGVKAGLMALHGASVKPIDGIIEVSVEESMKNIGILTQQGLQELDPAILQIMLHKSEKNA